MKSCSTRLHNGHTGYKREHQRNPNSRLLEDDLDSTKGERVTVNTREGEKARRKKREREEERFAYSLRGVFNNKDHVVPRTGAVRYVPTRFDSHKNDNKESFKLYQSLQAYERGLLRVRWQEEDPTSSRVRESRRLYADRESQDNDIP